MHTLMKIELTLLLLLCRGGLLALAAASATQPLDPPPVMSSLDKHKHKPHGPFFLVSLHVTPISSPRAFPLLRALHLVIHPGTNVRSNLPHSKGDQLLSTRRKGGSCEADNHFLSFLESSVWYVRRDIVIQPSIVPRPSRNDPHDHRLASSLAYAVFCLGCNSPCLDLYLQDAGQSRARRRKRRHNSGGTKSKRPGGQPAGTLSCLSFLGGKGAQGGSGSFSNQSS